MGKEKKTEYEAQKRIKPLIGDMIDQYLHGEMRKDAIEFVDFLKTNKMSPQWASTSSYSLSYKSRRVCIIKLRENEWELWLNTQYNEDLNVGLEREREEVKRIILNHLIHCTFCGKCVPGQNINILGQQVADACLCPVIRLKNPNGAELEGSRKLVLLRKTAIAEGKAPNIGYVARSKRNCL